MASVRVGNAAFNSALLGVMIALMLVKNWGTTYAGAPGLDFYQFWTVARSIDHVENSDVYAPGAHEKIEESARLDHLADPGNSRKAQGFDYRKDVETYGSPLFYCFIRPFSQMPYDSAFEAFGLLSTVCLVVSVSALAWLAGYFLAAGLAMVLFVLLACQPAISDLGMGNCNCVQLAGLTLFLVVRRSKEIWIREFVGGALLALVILFKPNVLGAAVLLGCWFLMRGQMATLGRLAAGGAVGTAISLAVSATLMPLRCWVDWIGDLNAMHMGAVMPTEAGNMSLAHLASSVGWPGFVAPALVVGICLGAVWICRGRELPEMAVAGLGVLMMLLGSQLAWFHYFVLAMPLVVYGLRPGGGAWAFAGALVASVVLFQFQTILFLGSWSALTWPILMGGAGIILGAACVAGGWNDKTPMERTARSRER
jgi:hypothetical protein